MYPYLFQGTPYQLVTWNVCTWSGVFVNLILLAFFINPKDFDLPKRIRFLTIFTAMIFAPLGGRMASILLNLKSFLEGKYVFLPSLIKGAQASLGSLLFIIIICYVVTRIFLKGVCFRKVLDFVIPLPFLNLIFVRIGCFFNGCCYGAYTKLPWACKFNGSLVPRHPTQLYSVIILIFVIVMTIKIYRKDFPPGTAFFSSLALYSFLRFFIELLRVDSFKIFNDVMFSPIFMIGLFIFSLTGLIVNFRVSKAKKA